MSIAVKTEDLTYIYSQGTPFQRVAVDKVNLEIQKGELIGVIGHTGSGKSTLVSHLNGLVKPTSGRVLIDGEDVWADEKNVRPFRFKVGLVFQYPEYQLFEETVYKDIAFGPMNMGLSEDEIAARVREAASYAGVSAEWLEKSPFELSGGQKRRVAIAGVLAMKPSVLILDEPTAGLDPKGRVAILDMVSRYHKETGSTVILISHSMEDVARYADRVLVMNNGTVFAFGTVEEVFSREEELSQIGLTIPSVSNIMGGIKSDGFSDIHKNVYTPEAAAKQLDQLIRRARNA